MNIIYISSLIVLMISLTTFLFTLISSKYTTKLVLILVLMITSFTAYFIDTYHVIIDTSMIRNALQTDMKESMDLFSFKLILYVLFLGIIPSLFVYNVKIKYESFFAESLRKIKTIILSLLTIAIVIFSFSKFYTSFLREHTPLRYYINPTYWIYNSIYYSYLSYNSGPIIVQKIGLDAKISQQNNSLPKLIVMVVGEAARADHFSLNGYKKDTNPFLSKRDDIINFDNFYSCGTSTAYSVPCMFSPLKRSEYSHKKFIRKENVMDVLHHTNQVEILWRDNNSDPKGVMDRLGYQNYKSSNNNPICDIECRDIGMLVGLDKFIQSHKNKNILIVLHQMGNHGPEYYKRYTKEFLKFKPICTTNQLEQCSQEEITNAYDNAILYTDYFLNKTINFLDNYTSKYQTALIYMSDHGESLGENGIYLHGLPYFMAPNAQKHIGAFMWFGSSFKDVNITKLKQNSHRKYSQDNLFSTLLGLFNVKIKVYESNMNIIKN